jgi:undecaprenyl-diphosphatase
VSEIVKVIILAIIEGITEFLPISSTGHLIVAAEFVRLRDSLQGVFEIFIQIGAVIAVIVFYRAEIWQQVRTVHEAPQVRHFGLMIIVAFIPAAVIGFLFGDQIDQYLFNPLNVAIALIVGGIFFIVVERLRPTPPKDLTRAETLNQAQKITFRQALAIGLWQLLALIPGMSRSGMTIMGGLLAGIDRATVTLFSFYLAIPTLGLATVYTLVKNLDKISRDDFAYLMIGAVLAGVVAYFAIGWLLRFVSRNTFIPFGIYRILLGIVILVLLASGMLA